MGEVLVRPPETAPPLALYVVRAMSIAGASCRQSELETEITAENAMAKVKHISLMKFKEGTSPDEIDRLFDELLDITESIPGIEDYVSGANCSPEGLNQGYTHAFIMTFQDVAARDACLPHPEHERLKATLAPHLDSMLVFDFEI